MGSEWHSLDQGYRRRRGAGTDRLGGFTTAELRMIAEIRKVSQIPIVLFTYLNPVYTYGYAKFHHDAAAAGADGVLVLDLPPDEAAENPELKPTPELRHIQLIAPTSPAERIKQIAPIWKHEHFEGGAVWIEGATADPSDEAARLAALERACT